MSRGVTVNLASNSETSVRNVSENVLQCGAVKTECKGPEEQVIHRKSARRRVARDIFLVFEQQPNRRQGRGSNRKRYHLKSKFGHLKVENPKPRSRVSSGLLRDIKNEPKCYLNSMGLCVNGPQQKLPKARSSGGGIIADERISNGIKAKSGAPVNPIFLWAKQDDTRIIEVRCEDYDKRNRIRIMKTTTGWRAIPRSDASTSRIVKFFQTPSSLMKLKREIYDSKLLQKNKECIIEPTDVDFSNSSSDAISFAEENQHMPIDLKETNINSKIDVDQHSENNNDHQNSNNCTCGVTRGDFLSVPLQEECSTVKHSSKQLSESESPSFCLSNTAKEIKIVTTNSDIFKTYTSQLRLCPKTGLFFSSASKDRESNELEENDNGLKIGITQCQMDSKNIPSVDSVIGSPTTNAKNLKDLLDDADLLQHCSDSINCDSELIDSLVKHGCESNLIGQTEVLNNSECVAALQNPRTYICSPKDSIDEGIVDNVLPQMTDTVSKQHNRLSFNEAGEIEEENGELFQTLEDFSMAFERESIKEMNTLNPKAIETINMPLRNATSLTEGALLINAVESYPKDLSYRKNEAVCEESESHGQCSVTSSSDKLLPPRPDKVPIAESGSENIKNFILEQFITLNALNSLPNTTNKMQESELIYLGQQNKKEIGSGLRKSASDLIETVFIDDRSNDEPAKKKLCNTADNIVVSHLASKAVSKNIDGDPDPLTQLQLLLRNTQWKVPDPILVPKDRLSAVLASPAREIPLLITTRPELRLPEAFAYPHIIKNPNILVISMAQLEAILKNEIEMEKTSLLGDAGDAMLPIKNIHMATKPQSKDLNTKCSFVESNNMATDINTATLAVINQMLWLPYIDQWSQEYLSSIQNPISVDNELTNFLSPYNHSTFGLQHLEVYKNNIAQISSSKLQPNDGETSNFQTSPLYMRAISAFQNHVDLMLLRKIFQQHIPNFPNSDQSSSLLSSSKKDETLLSFPECTSNIRRKQRLHTVNHQKCNEEVLNLNSTNVCTSDYNIGDALNKSYLQKASSNKAFAENEQKKLILKTKPRLTCKSLSNLLEPENRNLRTIPSINLTPKVPENGFFSNYHTQICIQQPASKHEAGFSSAENVKRRKSSINEQSQTIPDKDTEVTLMQENSVLAHTLFNSGKNNGYNSQWNWTTVTATGE